MISAVDFRGARFERLENVTQWSFTQAGPLRSGRVRRLADWWRAEAERSGRLPRKSSFDIAEHFVLAAYLFLAERQDAGGYWYRLRGEVVLWMFGGSERGRASGSYEMGQYGYNLSAYYDSVLAGAEPTVCRGDIRFDDGRVALFESVDCPLADETGAARFILGLSDIVDAHDTPA